MLQTLTVKENRLSAQIINVGTLLSDKHLSIPAYQRPYKWTVKNVTQLIDDILFHVDKGSYRLGTLVIHQNEDNNDIHDIVDGQQRTVTLVLIIKAILDFNPTISKLELRNQLDDLHKSMINLKFTSDLSIINIQENYREIQRRVLEFDEKAIIFLLDNCEFIKYTLRDISEAFQFFDSQNSRGKDLEPHDLLKAFHLREFVSADEPYKASVINTWENSSTPELKKLFGNFLYRVRRWSNNLSARYFTKAEVPIFKGVNLYNCDKMPFTQLLRIAHFYLDRYNESFERQIDFNAFNYPFQLDQTIINGRRFFEMISYYKILYDENVKHEILIKNHGNELDDISKEILSAINEYAARHRTGDSYVRTLFDCALLFFIDKFGRREINLAIQRIFIWAYKVRMDYQAIQLATIDNYVIREENIFRAISQMTSPVELKYLHLSPISTNYSSKTETIYNLFKKLNYYASAN